LGDIHVFRAIRVQNFAPIQALPARRHDFPAGFQRFQADASIPGYSMLA
jgi:hypothetical protein